ncbi:hypothetical protein CPT_Moonbeam224 [Bacillus phage Moonbeam]|uniref:Uncharacterized protein n=1 Tax=Bacillus phage Moonbeam TaxID=1540091 RepID=A0A0A0RNM6_9CAUD|nr:hypothetical protein CPT_Moonbeam224 [Bacillus phage Moonbeam]AIW03622.1 hypothetical protein CPT_Moonbeam224 [Bacillus phage Moonbeam]
MLSNFEKGFALYLEAEKEMRKSQRTRKFNESICLMASEDMELMRKIVVGQWAINAALSSPFASRYGL